MMFRIALLAAALTLAAPTASAQLGGLGVPGVPNVGLPGVGDTVGNAGRTVDGVTDDVRELTRARQEEVRNLLRRNRRELEADPNGEPIVRSQVLALAPSAEALERARAEGFTIVSSEDLEGGALVVLRAPEGMSTRRALDRLRDADPNGIYDFDHLHLESGVAPVALATAQQGAAAGPRIGLIDGGVNSGAVEQRAFVSQSPVPSAHANAVAQLLLSAAPGARLFVADIYGGAPTGGSSAALARALSWLASENTPVINISLVGPRNRIVETIIARTTARGILIVAAVGNDGPAAAPLYPAAYDGVIGVTGVDARDRVLMEAGRGAHVDFAAIGIQREPRVRGTSFAAPIVAGLLAAQLSAPDAAQSQQAVTNLRAQARDLGQRGRDNVYGEGLVGGNLNSASR
jgi:hypothetical protein